MSENYQKKELLQLMATGANKREYEVENAIGVQVDALWRLRQGELGARLGVWERGRVEVGGHGGRPILDGV